MIFIRIACLHCHILSSPCTLCWTQFSAVVAPTLTAWFFTPQQSHAGWPVISAFTATGPSVVDLLEEGFSAFPPAPPGDTHCCCAGMNHLQNYNSRGLSRVRQKTALIWDVQVTHTHTHSADRQLRAETVRADITAPQRVWTIDGR